MTTPSRQDPGAGASEQELFDAYYPRVRSFFFSRGLPEVEVEDLTQEAFIRVFQHMGKLRSPGSRSSWVLRICANLWKNELRHRTAKKRNAPISSLDQKIEAGFDPADQNLVGGEERADALSALLTEEVEGVVRSCFDELPPKMRRCFELHLHQRRTYDEIATLLHIVTQTVKSHIHQAKEKLRGCTERKLGGKVPG